MIDIDLSMTLGEVVDANPALAREFEMRSLDYCCGGRRTLGDACAMAGLDPAQLLADLRAAAGTLPPAAWTTMTVDELVDHLENVHHRYLWHELPRLTTLVDKIAVVHATRHPELSEIAACFAEIRAELEPHLLREERVLFPMIREMANAAVLPAFRCGTLRNPISVMLREHDDVGELLTRLRELTDGYTPPDDGCASFIACFAGLAEMEADTHLHIHKENNVLFPMVTRMETERSNSVLA